MFRFLKWIFTTIVSIIVLMAQIPLKKVVFNISTYIPDNLLKTLPVFIQTKSFDKYITIISILLLFAIFRSYIYFFVKYIIKVISQAINKKKVVVSEKIIDSEFISFKNAMAILIQQISSNALRLDSYDNLIYSNPQVSFHAMQLEKERRIIFNFIIGNHLSLYAHRIIDSIDTRHLPLSIIPNLFFKKNNIYDKDNWGDNYATIYNDGRMTYTNISIKSEDFNNFIKKHGLNK